MEQFKNIQNYIPVQLKNRYVITVILFFIWMLFFDSNDIISQIKLRMELGRLKAQQTFYQTKIKEIKASKEELLNDKAALERFARERYWMKKDDEDLFIVVPKEDQ